jgi:hypothetical protein
MEVEIQRLRNLRCRRIGQDFSFAVYTPKKWKKMSRWLKSPVKDIELRYVPHSVYDAILQGAEKVRPNRQKLVFKLFDKIRLVNHPFIAALIDRHQSYVALRYLDSRGEKCVKYLEGIRSIWNLHIFKGSSKYRNLKYINFMNSFPLAMYFDFEENLCNQLGTGDLRLWYDVFRLPNRFPEHFARVVDNIKDMLVKKYNETSDVEEKDDIERLHRRFFPEKKLHPEG